MEALLIYLKNPLTFEAFKAEKVLRRALLAYRNNRTVEHKLLKIWNTGMITMEHGPV